MEYAVECRNLTHYYGEKKVYENMSFNIRTGSILGLLGKNGTGKTTTINILHGFLEPRSGECFILGENSQQLSPATKSRVGFLLEGHIQYDFMNIYQIEKFYSAFYPRWKREPYYELMSKLAITPKQKISTMSCGQQSQVALGLILAQDPDLMILDDFSMGLDPGYRRLFIEFLAEYGKAENKTIFVTSHIIQDMEMLIDDCVVLGYEGVLQHMPVKELMDTFHQYDFTVVKPELKLESDEIIISHDLVKKRGTVYSFKDADTVKQHLTNKNVIFGDFHEVKMSLEDAFIGITGKY
jgi:ABC-2 type transport system ATP-binding protein